MMRGIRHYAGEDFKEGDLIVSSYVFSIHGERSQAFYKWTNQWEARYKCKRDIAHRTTLTLDDVEFIGSFYVLNHDIGSF
jgi:hypothetical protein